ncbi:MAG: hypothetical protein QG559_878 [Campylobacterota bacterium]|nr:hypothetical protein [Campylobacterota bacterium]
MEAKALHTLSYLSIQEMQEYLQNVEYIIMAAPAPEKFGETPIHFTIFLNTSENLPKEIAQSVLDKFLKENSISKPSELLSRLMPVGLAKSTQETYMPLLIVKQEDMVQIPHLSMFVMDFLADSSSFEEVKKNHLTGWTYSYN